MELSIYYDLQSLPIFCVENSIYFYKLHTVTWCSAPCPSWWPPSLLPWSRSMSSLSWGGSTKSDNIYISNILLSSKSAQVLPRPSPSMNVCTAEASSDRQPTSSKWVLGKKKDSKQWISVCTFFRNNPDFCRREEFKLPSRNFLYISVLTVHITLIVKRINMEIQLCRKQHVCCSWTHGIFNFGRKFSQQVLFPNFPN